MCEKQKWEITVEFGDEIFTFTEKAFTIGEILNNGQNLVYNKNGTEMIIPTRNIVDIRRKVE